MGEHVGVVGAGEVPLADGGVGPRGFAACGAQSFWAGDGLQRQRVVPGPGVDDPSRARAPGVAAGQQHAAGRRADRPSVGGREPQPSLGEAVEDGGCGRGAVPACRDLVDADVVREHHEEVAPWGFGDDDVVLPDLAIGHPRGRGPRVSGPQLICRHPIAGAADATGRGPRQGPDHQVSQAGDRHDVYVAGVAPGRPGLDDTRARTTQQRVEPMYRGLQRSRGDRQTS